MLVNRSKGRHMITSKIEHPAVLQTCEKLETQGFEVTYLNVNKGGFISLEALENSIKDETIDTSIKINKSIFWKIKTYKIFMLVFIVFFIFDIIPIFIRN